MWLNSFADAALADGDSAATPIMTANGDIALFTCMMGLRGTPQNVSQLTLADLVYGTLKREIAKRDSLVSRLQTTIAYWRCAVRDVCCGRCLQSDEGTSNSEDTPKPTY
jgi:hypothetical protein